MTDLNRPVLTHSEPVNSSGLARPIPMTTTGPLFDSRDMVAGVVAIIMNLGPLAAAAFWAPYH